MKPWLPSILVTGLDDPTWPKEPTKLGPQRRALHDQLKEAILEAAASSDVTAN
jgi:hypothetical protein